MKVSTNTSLNVLTPSQHKIKGWAKVISQKHLLQSNCPKRLIRWPLIGVEKQNFYFNPFRDFFWIREKCNLLLVWNWLTHYLKFNRKFCVHLMYLKRTSNTVILSLSEELPQYKTELYGCRECQKKKSSQALTKTRWSLHPQAGYKISNTHYLEKTVLLKLRQSFFTLFNGWR